MVGAGRGIVATPAALPVAAGGDRAEIAARRADRQVRSGVPVDVRPVRHVLLLRVNRAPARARVPCAEAAAPADDPAGFGQSAAVASPVFGPVVPRAAVPAGEGARADRDEASWRGVGLAVPAAAPADRLAVHGQRAGVFAARAHRRVASRRRLPRVAPSPAPADDRAVLRHRAGMVAAHVDRRVAARRDVRLPPLVVAPAHRLAGLGEGADMPAAHADRRVAPRRRVEDGGRDTRRRRRRSGRNLRRRLGGGFGRGLRCRRRRGFGRRGRRGGRDRRPRSGRRRRGVLAAAAAGEEREDGERCRESGEGAGHGRRGELRGGHGRGAADHSPRYTNSR